MKIESQSHRVRVSKYIMESVTTHRRAGEKKHKKKHTHTQRGRVICGFMFSFYTNWSHDDDDGESKPYIIFSYLLNIIHQIFTDKAHHCVNPHQRHLDISIEYSTREIKHAYNGLEQVLSSRVARVARVARFIRVIRVIRLLGLHRSGCGNGLIEREVCSQ